MKPLPVKGYTDQSEQKVDLVNHNKELEERVLRQIDYMTNTVLPFKCDQRMIAIARTEIQTAFMWLNRAIFQPGRVDLPEDKLPPQEN